MSAALGAGAALLWDVLTYGLDGVAPIRPLQAPSFGGAAHPSLADPILLARPEGAPLRELERAGASLRRRLKS